MKNKYLILGDGRLARHLTHYFSELNFDYTQWSRECNTREDLLHMSASCSHALFLLKDSVIEDFVKLPIWEGKTLIHCSGALVIEGCFSVHPLMSFAHGLYEVCEYENIPFVIDSKAPEFDELFPGLPNPHFRMKEELKPLYHALCVCGGNFMTILWQMVFSESEKSLGLSYSAYLPYIERIVRNLESNPDNALTGPFAREDFSTIEANLNALKGTKLELVYDLFKKLYFEEATKL